MSHEEICEALIATFTDASFKVDENTFVAEQKGKYTLRVVAYDEYYNYVVKEIEFQVK